MVNRIVLMTSPYWNQAAKSVSLFFSSLLVITYTCLPDSEVISSASLCILSMILYLPLSYSYTRSELETHCCIIYGLKNSKIHGQLQSSWILLVYCFDRGHYYWQFCRPLPKWTILLYVVSSAVVVWCFLST